MKVLLVTEDYWPNADGGALFERRLAQGLVALGNTVTVWAPGARANRSWEPDGSYRIRREGAVRFVWNTKYKVSYWPFLEARRLLRTTSPDVVHIHNPYWMGLTALYWARRQHIPIIATNHFMPENALLNLRGIAWVYGPLYRLTWKYLVWFHNQCDFVVSPTPTAVQLLIRNGLKRPAEAISNGIDIEVFCPGLETNQVRARYDLPSDKPILLYVGRVDGEKRLDIIIQALPLIIEQQPVHLVIAGYGIAMDRLRALATRLGVTSRITFTGFVDEADKPALYNVASAFVIASPAELQSIVTLEAMASGLPILAVDIAALSELCHDGQNGYLFPAGDYQGLAQSAIKLLSSTTTIKQFGTESRKIVQSYHATDATIKAYEQAYLHAIELAKS